MRILSRALAASVLLAAACSSAHAASTINPTVPAQGSNLTSAVVRNNFAAAYNDVSNILGKFAGTAAPANQMAMQDWVDTSASPVYKFRLWNPSTATWVQWGSLNINTGAFSVVGSSGSFAATAPLTVTFPSGVTTYGLNADSNFAVSGGNLALASVNNAHLLANCSGASPAEPGNCAWTTFADQAVGASNGMLPYRAGGTWGSISTGTSGATIPLNSTANVFSALQSIITNATTPPAPNTGALLALGNVDGTVTRVELTSAGAQPVYSGRTALGTIASPLTLTSGSLMLSVNAHGYDGTSWATAASGALHVYAQGGTWSNTSHPTEVCDAVTPIGSTTIADQLCVLNDGGVEVPPGVSGGDKGVGTINAVGYYVAGSAVASSVSAPLALNASTGALSITGAAGQVLAGAAPAFTATPVLGVAGTTVGSVGFQNLSTGTETIQPATGALGSGIATLAAGTYNLLGDSLTQTLTNKTIASSTDSLGGVTTALGSDATGDIYYRNSGGVLTRLPIGSGSNLLTVSGGLPAWVAPTGGGNVSNTGTPTASQMAQWTNATTIQGVNIASVLTAGSGIAITGTTNASIAIASQAAFSAALSAAQTGVVSGTTTLAAFNTTAYNVGGLFNTSTNRWVPPAGTVVMDACIYATGAISATSSISAFIYKNGTGLYQAINDAVSTQGGNCLTVQDRANGTDYYQVFVNLQTTAGTATLGNNTAPALNFFQGHWVSP